MFKRETVNRIALGGFGVLLSVVLVEVALHIYFPAPTYGNTLVPDAALGWVHTPNASAVFTHVPDVPRTPIRINSHGFRDVEHTFTKPPNTFRILVLGDSFVEAYQTPLEKTFPRLLEGTVACLPPGTKVEVINAGIGGYSPAQYYLTYETIGYKYQADLVLAEFLGANDVWTDSFKLDLWFARRPFFQINDGELIRVPHPSLNKPSGQDASKTPGLFETAKGFFRDNSRLYFFVGNFLRERVPAVAKPLKALGILSPDSDFLHPDFGVYSTRYTPEWEEAWEITKRLYLDLDKAVRSRGARLAVFSIPVPAQVHPDAWKTLEQSFPIISAEKWDSDKPDTIIAPFLQERHIPVLPLLPAFREEARRSGDYLYYPHDGHWDSAGHRLATMEIARFLCSTGLASQVK